MKISVKMQTTVHIKMSDLDAKEFDQFLTNSIKAIQESNFNIETIAANRRSYHFGHKLRQLLNNAYREIT